MNTKYDIQVVIGWQTRLMPVPGSPPRETHGVGTHLKASAIIILDGVPYAELINPQKPEWGRLGERGYIVFDDNGGLILNDSVKHYAVPTEIHPTHDNIPAPGWAIYHDGVLVHHGE